MYVDHSFPQQSRHGDGAEELDRELDEIVRSAYHSVNQDYLRQQAINALVASGKNREEAEAWLNQCEFGTIEGGKLKREVFERRAAV